MSFSSSLQQTEHSGPHVRKYTKAHCKRSATHHVTATSPTVDSALGVGDSVSGRAGEIEGVMSCDGGSSVVGTAAGRQRGAVQSGSGASPLRQPPGRGVVPVVGVTLTATSSRSEVASWNFQNRSCTQPPSPRRGTCWHKGPTVRRAHAGRWGNVHGSGLFSVCASLTASQRADAALVRNSIAMSRNTLPTARCSTATSKFVICVREERQVS